MGTKTDAELRVVGEFGLQEWDALLVRLACPAALGDDDRLVEILQVSQHPGQVIQVAGSRHRGNAVWVQRDDINIRRE